MRKQYKKKKRSCPICKPHKTGATNRWKNKERAKMKSAEREMKQATL